MRLLLMLVGVVVIAYLIALGIKALSRKDDKLTIIHKREDNDD